MSSNITTKAKAFLAKPIFHDRRTILWLWIALSVIAAVLKYNRTDNNYRIFRGVFWHTLQCTSLYAEYPLEYYDVNHYGPFFSLVIAPFALMPIPLGLVFWCIALSLTLYFAITRSTFSSWQQMFVLWFCSETLLTSLFMQQFNITIAAIIIASYALIEKERDFWAACLIVLGTFVKLYGIVGLAFFFFSRHKGKFVLSLLFWGVVLFVAPMIISSPGYVVSQYHEWFVCLVEKNGENLASEAQNISALGMVRRVLGNPQYSDLLILAPALVLFALPYLRFKQWRNEGFRMTLLASVLLFTVLFSTGSESSSYIIALSGVCVWYFAAPWQRGKADIWLLVFVFLLSSMGSSDLYPRAIKREYIQAYSLKALPCLIVWLKLCWEMMAKNYQPHPQTLTKDRGE
ncbi:glycosyltransferase family 87 protein [Prevotella sp. oral taxon 317]|uniref:glycosyltransferase family 87 protein n=1 Tax=Prevotella sp. oral taxon 317 TaxID=652721 RepID=UPI0005C5F120|nr:glycosyltransferase family 87 protein [Prevotella sp. oral taxon 317]